MPWEERSLMDVRLRFVQDVHRPGWSVAGRTPPTPARAPSTSRCASVPRECGTAHSAVRPPVTDSNGASTRGFCPRPWRASVSSQMPTGSAGAAGSQIFTNSTPIRPLEPDEIVESCATLPFLDRIISCEWRKPGRRF